MEEDPHHTELVREHQPISFFHALNFLQMKGDHDNPNFITSCSGTTLLEYMIVQLTHHSALIALKSYGTLSCSIKQEVKNATNTYMKVFSSNSF